ncbi:type II secretion system protein [Planctomycetota bacterium]
MGKRKGFTLIELLVVIAVIAVLLGILMPALSAARKQAWGAVCKNGLRSIGMAMALYAEDNDYFIPRGVTGGNARPAEVWFLGFMPYLAQDKKQTDYRDVKIYKCPGFPDKRQTVCYVANAYDASINGEWDTTKQGPFKLTRYKRLAATIYLADNEHGDWRTIVEDTSDYLDRCDIYRASHMPSAPPEPGSTTTDIQARRVAQDRHVRGYNALFADARVAQVRTLKEGDQPAGRPTEEEELRMWVFHK